MILPELVIQSNINKSFRYSGIDSINSCTDQEHFLSYPHDIEYNYNSRGFRDLEWPESRTELRDAVWCVGDSFTVGLGSAFMHTWPNRLIAAINRRTINVSMDGASNEWISRIAEAIAKEVNPANIIIMWSYTHRREHPDDSLNSELRRLHYVKSTVEKDWENFLDCSKRLSLLDSNIVEFAIPQFHESLIPDLKKFWHTLRGVSWPLTHPKNVNELNDLPMHILLELEKVHGQLDRYRRHLTAMHLLEQQNITLVESLDRARDGHHFDLVTADWVAAQAVPCLV